MTHPTPAPDRGPVLRTLAALALLGIFALVVAFLWTGDWRYFWTALLAGIFLGLPLSMAAWPTGIKR